MAALIANSGKVAIVTGAGSGIGAAIAELFCKSGYHVVTCDIDGQAGAGTAHRIGATFVRADITVPNDRACLLETACERFGGIDVLVNNAGLIASTPLFRTSEEDFDRLVAVNLKAAFFLTQAVAARMLQQLERGRAAGAIINVSSINARLATMDRSVYCITKGAVDTMTRALAVELAHHGIRVNAVGPGSVASENVNRQLDADAKLASQLLSRTPLGRLASPSEIATAVLFLASDAASYITGQTIYADGGRLALNLTMEH